ncbi:MAG: hypothetical protein IH880_00420 [Candidatus Marinimicrobia bacterium]|nr:hypothetical protein [Candidatus Neomarinimicrobiota bacterium]MCH7886732.1 hypothetical protein [Candidatus Neomarinimicrobiota bacterium]
MKNTLSDFFGAFRKTIIVWTLLIIFVIAGVYFGVPKKIIGGSIIAVGWVTGAFAGLMIMIGLVPLVGPIIVSVLSLPVIWLLNGLGYFVSIIAIKKGYSKEVVNSRILTAVLIVGIVIGYVISKLIDYFGDTGFNIM